MTIQVPSVLVSPDRMDVDGLLDAIEEMESALKAGTRPVAPIREAGKDADATGAWLKGNDRIVHRVAGLSKTNAALDPFRTRATRAKKADSTQRGDGENFVRREILHVSHAGFETSIVVMARKEFALSPDKDDPDWRMRVQLGLVADAVKAARFAKSHPAPSMVAASYACGVLEAMREPPIRGAVVVCTMPSPLGRGSARIVGVSPVDIDSELMPILHADGWPSCMRLIAHATDTSRTWTIGPMTGQQRLVDIDPIERLRIMSDRTPSFMDFLEHGEPIR